MSRCAVCNDDLDGKPAAFLSRANMERLGPQHGPGTLGSDVCLTCGVMLGGSWEGIELTLDGVAAAIERAALVARRINRLAAEGMTADEIQARYAEHMGGDAS